MGNSVEHLRELIELAKKRVDVKPHLRHVDGKIVKVKGFDYLRDLPIKPDLDYLKVPKPPKSLLNAAETPKESWSSEDVIAAAKEGQNEVKLAWMTMKDKLVEHRKEVGGTAYPSQSQYVYGDEEQKWYVKTMAEFATLHTQAAKRFEQLQLIKKVNYPHIESKKLKTDLTKLRNRFEDLDSALRLAKALENDEPIDLDWATEQLDRWDKRLKNEGTNYGNYGVFQYLPQFLRMVQAPARARIWKEKLDTVLPFDLDTVSNAQLLSYMKQVAPDFIDAPALSQDERKIWVQLQLGGWPNKELPWSAMTDKDGMKKLEGEAHKRVLISNLKAQLLTGMKAQSSLTVEPSGSPELEMIQKRMQVEATLKQSYHRTPTEYGEPSQLVQTEANTWDIIFPDGSKSVGNTNAAVSHLMEHDDWEATSDEPATTALSELIESIPDPKASVVDWNAWVKEHGGTAVNKMGADEKLHWALMEVHGNRIGQYQMEEFMASKAKQKEEYSFALWQTPMSGKTFEHELRETHTGSPHSPDGQLAIQTLSDWIASKSWGEAFFNTNIIEEKYAWRPRYKDPGPYKFIHRARSLNAKKGGTPWSKEEIKQAWLDLGLYVGTPYQDDPDGASPKYMRNAVQVWLRWLPEEMPDPKTGGGLAQSTAPTTITDLPETEKPAELDNISDDAWAFVLGVEAAGDDPEFWKELDPGIYKATELNIQTKLKSLYIDDDIKYALLDAPLQVKKAYIYGGGGIAPLGFKTPGIIEAISYRASKGYYAPKYPSATVTFPWGVQYELLPGDIVKKDPTTGAFLVLHHGGGGTGFFPNTSPKKYGVMSPLVAQAREWWVTWLPSSDPVEVTKSKPVVNLMNGALDIPDGADVWVHELDADNVTAGGIPENGVVYVKDGKYNAFNASGTQSLFDAEWDSQVWVASGWKQLSSGSVPDTTASVATPAKPIDKDVAREAFTTALGIMFDYDWDLIETASNVSKLNEMLSAGNQAPLGHWSTIAIADIDSAMLKGGVHVTMFDAPEPVRRLAAWAMENKDTGLRTLIEWLASHGHWGHKTAAPDIDPEKPYAVPISKGLTSPQDIESWEMNEKQTFLQDYAPNVAYYASNAPQIISDLIALTNPRIPIAAPSESVAAQTLIFTLDPEQPAWGGMHSKVTWRDQTGLRWMAKMFPSDPNAKGRVNAEHAGNQIGRLHAFASPRSFAQKMPDGHYSVIQEELYPGVPGPNKKIMGYKPDDLTDAQLFQVAEEHILDWVISNHDSHNDNFIKSPDGKVIHGVDKGQAFKFFPKDKLAVGYLPPGNGAPVYYDVIYQGIANGTIPEHRADRLVEHLLKRAKRVSLLRDDAHRALLEFATKDFPGGVTPEAKKAGWNHDEFVDALMERKHSAMYDFEKLYKELYEKAGYTWKLPSVDELASARVENDQGDVYVGISQELVDDVSQAKVHGVSTMFNSSELEDGHFLFWEETEADGGTLFMGEARFRPKFDSIISKWIDSQKIENKSGTTAAPVTPAVQVSPAAVLPYNDSWYATIVKAAKTVNTHAADGAYNSETIAQFDSAVTEMKGGLDLLGKHLAANPGKVFTGTEPSFINLHQQQAWLEMVELYLGYAAKIQTAKDNGAKTYSGAPEFFEQYEYTPKPMASVDVEFTDVTGNITIQGLTDGTFIKTEKDKGTQVELSPQEASDLLTSPAFADEEGGKGETLTIVTPEGPDIKVVRVQNSRSEGTFQPSTGTVVHTGGEETTGTPGYEYDIHAGDITIEYRKHDNKDGVPVPQKGLMRVKIRNFKNDPAKVEEAMNLIEMMGVTLDPADEESLELLFWRHLRGIATDRLKPGGEQGAKLQQTLTAIQSAYQTDPGMSPSEELAMLRKSWAIYLGEEGVENAKWMPQFSRTRPHAPNLQTGHPYWLRPDFTLEDVLQLVTPSRWPVQHLGTDAKQIAVSGGLLSSEERLRTLGKWVQGISSLQDQKTHASSAFIFTYVSQGQTNPTHSSGNRVWWSPKVLQRTSNYAWDGDKWGNIYKRKDHAPWKLEQFMATHGEMMVKNIISVLDDIDALQFSNEQSRNSAIAWFKDRGITEIRGIPVEERFVVSSADLKATLTKQHILYQQEAKALKKKVSSES